MVYFCFIDEVLLIIFSVDVDFNIFTRIGLYLTKF